MVRYSYPEHINYPEERKPPKEHEVKSHMRLGKRVDSYVRGKKKDGNDIQ